MAEVNDNIPKLLNRGTNAVLLSIGETDLRRGMSLYEMKRLFTSIFLACESYKLKPLVTTVMCWGPKLSRKANIFNKFIMDNFANVVDMGKVHCGGLESALHNLYNG